MQQLCCQLFAIVVIVVVVVVLVASTVVVAVVVVVLLIKIFLERQQEVQPSAVFLACFLFSVVLFLPLLLFLS